MTIMTNPFAEKYRDRILANAELFSERHLFRRIGKLGNNGEFLVLLLYTAVATSLTYIVMSWLFSSKTAFGVAFLSIFVHFFSGMYAEYIICEKRPERLWRKLASEFAQEDFQWIAKTLRDYWRRPEFIGLFDEEPDAESEDKAANIKALLKKEFHIYARNALSSDPDVQLKVLKYVLSPTTQTDMNNVGWYSGKYSDTLSASLLKALNADVIARNHKVHKEVDRVEIQRLEAQLSAL